MWCVVMTWFKDDSHKTLRLIYGRDPWAEEEDNDLIVLDLDAVDILSQMAAAETWGEATRGFPNILEFVNECREDQDLPPRQHDDPFDFYAECMSENGMVLNINQHVEYGVWLKDDEDASVFLNQLKEAEKW